MSNPVTVDVGFETDLDPIEGLSTDEAADTGAPADEEQTSTPPEGEQPPETPDDADSGSSEPQDKSDAQIPVFSPELLAQAEEYGLPPAAARAFGNPQALQTWLRLQETGGPPAEKPSPEAPASEKPEEPPSDFNLEFEDEDLADSEYAQKLKALHDHYSKQMKALQKEIAEQRQAQTQRVQNEQQAAFQQEVRTFDSLLDGMEDVTAHIGKSTALKENSPEVALRSEVWDEYLYIHDRATQRNQTISREEAARKAVLRVLAEHDKAPAPGANPKPGLKAQRIGKPAATRNRPDRISDTRKEDIEGPYDIGLEI